MATTTLFQFAPSTDASPPYSFSFETEGEIYTGQVTWNLAGQRWYLQVYDSSFTLLINHPLISSPTSQPQNLVPGIFSRTTISFSQIDSLITVVEQDEVAQQTVEAVAYLGLANPIAISINDIVVSVGGSAVKISISDVTITLSEKAASVTVPSDAVPMVVGTASMIGNNITVAGDGTITLAMKAVGGTFLTSTTQTITGTASEINAQLQTTAFTPLTTSATITATATNDAGSNTAVMNVSATVPAPVFNVLQTNGGKVVDSKTGDPVILKSVNWAGAEANNYVPDGLWQVSYKDLINQIAEWGFNSIRFPFSGDTFKQSAPASGAINLYAKGTDGDYDNLDFTTNQDATNPEWKTIYGVFDTIISYCATKGLRVIFDHHRRASGSGGTDGAPTDASYTQADWEATWVALGQHYSAANGFSNVCGADLHNEPYQLTWSDWVTACNGVITALQAVNPDWLIIVEGVGTYDNRSTWWAGQLQGVAVGQYYVSVLGIVDGGTGWSTGDTFSFNGGTGTVATESNGVVKTVSILTASPVATDPSSSSAPTSAITGSGTGLTIIIQASAAPQAVQPTLAVANKLVYSPHEYGQSVGAQNWLETTTQTVANYPNNLPAVWDSFWGYIVKQNIAPVWIGEFGGQFGVNGSGVADPTQVNASYEKQWVSTLVDYVKANGISFSYWDLNPDSTDTGGLLEDDWVTPQSVKIGLIQPLLSE